MEWFYRLHAQVAEILSSDNRWFCSQHHRREVHDKDVLSTYFIKSGGAKNFADRWRDAMSEDNRWFCGLHYGREITCPRILWLYYMAVLRGIAPPPLEGPQACRCL